MQRLWSLLLLVWLACLSCFSGLAQGYDDHISFAELPPEARTTLQLIESGGPFPYSRDGVVFGNYEKRLPQKKRGYYHEYTVPTPGMKTRGARRIIAGNEGERYYTADHYNSFRRIQQ